MTINFDNINDTQKLQIADMLSKIESLDGVLADIQTEKAVAGIAWEAKKQEVDAEKNKITEEMRVMRKATVAKQP